MAKHYFSQFIAKVKVEILHKNSNTKSYNKTVTDFNFGWHKDLSTIKSDIHRGLRFINPQKCYSSITFEGW